MIKWLTLVWTACCDCWGMCSNEGPFIYSKQHINIQAIIVQIILLIICTITKWSNIQNKLWSISNDWSFQFLIGNCSPARMFCTMYDTKSTFCNCLDIWQLTEWYLFLLQHHYHWHTNSSRLNYRHLIWQWSNIIDLYFLHHNTTVENIFVDSIQKQHVQYP